LESEINDYKSRLGNVDQSLAGRLKEAERKISDYEKELNTWKSKYSTDKTSWDNELKRLNDLLA
jgi:predicted RNase H-like nuclease (RuvC/YqgF family)